MLTCYIDFKSAAAYLALKPTLSLADRLGVEVEWRPFVTVERDVPKLGQQETVGESHRRVRAASQRALAIKYAAHQEIDLRFPPELGATDLALGVLAELPGDRLPFIRAGFEAYWTEHQNLNDPEVVAQMLHNGQANPGFKPATARAALAVAQAAAEDAGIVGAPAYVIDGQIFVGRAHLPWIEEIALGIAARPS